jgi:tetratricopeptide (TPR) repeat protein
MVTRRLLNLGRAVRRLSAASLPLFALVLAVAAQPVETKAAQEPGESSSKRSNAPLPKDTSAQPDPDGKIAAQEDIDIGDFYMHKGDADAAIGRYQDAAEVAPKFGKPRLLLAEAFEKKGEKARALKYYKEYLAVEPNAPGKQKIEKKIEKLSSR